jgi:large subunit ribosomal protein L21
MYAIIRAGGKQAKVQSGDVIEIERVKGDSEELSFSPLLVVDDKGNAVSDRDLLAKASVTAKVLGESQGQKIDIFKYKNKTGYRRRQGHRQKYTQIEITEIKLPGAKAKSSGAKSSGAKTAAAKSGTAKASEEKPAAKATAAKTTAAKPSAAKSTATSTAAKATAAKTTKQAKTDSSEEE